MEAGIDDVGIGVLFGLAAYRYDLAGLLMHAEHLEAAFGVGPHTISVPRVRAATGVDSSDFENAISDDAFAKIIAVIRISVPYTGMIISTRESEVLRERVLALGVSQISGGSSTSIGGYSEKENAENCTAQFEVIDSRSLDEIVHWLLGLGYVPSFCTACYRQGRTGDRFMTLVKNGQIANICEANSLLTLKEYLEDYASAETKANGETVISEQLKHIPNQKVREKTSEYLQQIKEGKRDFRF
jgi:2-iminoacetate synthase